MTVSTRAELGPKHEWEETGDTGMAQLIVIAVLHSDSDLIKIHIVNGEKKKKRHAREFEKDTFTLNIIYII